MNLCFQIHIFCYQFEVYIVDLTRYSRFIEEIYGGALMEKKNVSLTAAEWNVMECLWEKSPQTLMQLVSALRERVGWAKSTTTTMLSRMKKKEIISCVETGKPRRYTPAVKREDAVEQETRSFMNRVFRGSVGMMINTLVEQQNLTPEEIQELYAILQRAGGEKK